MQNDTIEFQNERLNNLKKAEKDPELTSLTRAWFRKASDHKYSYNFDWLGVPIIQFPQDIVALQEIIWKTKPDVIVETGVARGGSVIFSASMLQLLNGDGRVIGIDIDIRPHNRKAIEEHPLAFRIDLIEGSSIDPQVVDQVKAAIRPDQKVMVILDSNHTHDHVLKELEAYATLVTPGNYLVVFDTVIEDMPENYFSDRPWDKGNNPKTAVREYVHSNSRFELDQVTENKLLISVAPEGYYKCVK